MPQGVACEPRGFQLPSAGMIDLIFGNGYEALLMTVALVAAIPYGIYVGIKKLGAKLFGGKTNGDSRTG